MSSPPKEEDEASRDEILKEREAMLIKRLNQRSLKRKNKLRPKSLGSIQWDQPAATDTEETKPVSELAPVKKVRPTSVGLPAQIPEEIEGKELTEKEKNNVKKQRKKDLIAQKKKLLLLKKSAPDYPAPDPKEEKTDEEKKQLLLKKKKLLLLMKRKKQLEKNTLAKTQ